MDSFLILVAVIVGLAVLLAPIGVLNLSRKIRTSSARIDELERAAFEDKMASTEATDKTGADPNPWVAPEDRRAAISAQQDIVQTTPLDGANAQPAD